MKKRYLIIGIISMLILMVGVSYAYFTGMIVGSGAPISVKAKKLAVIFTDTSEIVSTQIIPGWNVSKTFTVENKSGSVFYYDINIDDLVNTFVTEGYLQYKITSDDGGYNMTEFIDIAKSNEARREKLVGDIEIEDGSIHTYKVEFRYVDSDEDQSADMGKIFSGSLSITESNIVVVKYKVNNVIQDKLPDKTEPYITSTVTCSNNAEGIWNEEKETVELTNNVKQTVCIVEFKEGYTVTLNMDENSGSVVAPTSKVVGRIGKAEFQININNGYDIEKTTIGCDNGAEIKIDGTKVTITNITQDTVCTITPKGIDYTVTYNPNNGTGVSPTSNIVTFGEKYKLPGTNPTRTGYTFAGWYTEASGGTEVTTNTKVTNASNHSIYAHWTANTITVTYDVNGGNTLNPGSKTVTYGSTYESLPTPTRDGHTFAGWWTAASGGTEATSSTQVTNANNHSIFAHWTINSYNVTVKVVNGTPTSETKSVNYGGSTTFTIKAKDGYKLDGATVTCDSGGSYNQAGIVTFSNVTSARSCTITLSQSKVTFTITSNPPDLINNNSSACYIAYHSTSWSHSVGGGYNFVADWDKTATYNNKAYLNCTKNSQSVTWKDTSGRLKDCFPSYGCSMGFIGGVNINGNKTSVWGFFYTDGDGDDFVRNATCSVNLTCDPA